MVPTDNGTRATCNAAPCSHHESPVSSDWLQIRQNVRRYFRLRWVTPPRPFLQRDKRYLFLHFPHAVFPMGSWLSVGLTGDEGAPQQWGATYAGPKMWRNMS